MSKLVVSLFLCIGFLAANAQQVTFEDLIKMNSEKASDATDFLPQKKKWVEHLNNTSNIDSAVVILKSEFNKQDKSRHWISIYSENDKPKTISYQTTKKMYVDKILTDLKAAGFTLSGSRETLNSMVLIYTKDNINIEVMTFAGETGTGAVYQVTLNS